MNEEFRHWLGASDTATAPHRRLTLLTRHGQPLLYLPRERGPFRHALELYPAQRPAARMAKRILRLVCAAGLSSVLRSTPVAVKADAPLSRFLCTLTGQRDVPNFAILAGNPGAPGRRFIFLVFDAQQRPAVVVKAGGNKQAIALIEREAALLEAIASDAAGIPRLRAVHRTDAIRALALDYAEGRTPGTAINNDRMAEVLCSWIDGKRSLRADRVPAWQRLLEACPDTPVLRQVRERLESVSFHPVLYHGDFAPWNVKVQRDGAWRVLDWERGELTGMPCWDWFHYRVQMGLLVQRLPTESHANHIERWLQETHFREYAKRTATADISRELLLAYLIYSMEILGPRPSLPAKRDLLNRLATRWKSA